MSLLKEAVKIQHALQDHVKFENDFGEIKTVAGVDVGFEENNTITRANVKPLYISPGHRVSIDSAHKLVMKCVTRYRLPETTRWAHKLAIG